VTFLEFLIHANKLCVYKFSLKFMNPFSQDGWGGKSPHYVAMTGADWSTNCLKGGRARERLKNHDERGDAHPEGEAGRGRVCPGGMHGQQGGGGRGDASAGGAAAARPPAGPPRLSPPPREGYRRRGGHRLVSLAGGRGREAGGFLPSRW